MGEKEYLLTQEGYDNLEKTLEDLKTNKRNEIAERIKVALGFGDLSENSEYDEAKNAQAQNRNQWLPPAPFPGSASRKSG